MIISEKLPGWSVDIPRAYLFKYNNSSKKYDFMFEITGKIAYRYRHSMPPGLPDVVDDTNKSATKAFGWKKVITPTTTPPNYEIKYVAYYNSCWRFLIYHC